MSMRALSFFVALLALGGPILTVTAEEEEPVHISVVRLIATPDAFDGRHVITEGLAVIGFEADAIYVSKETAEHGSLVNDVGLVLDRERDFGHLHLKWVIVDGTFKKDRESSPRRAGRIVDVVNIFAVD